MASVRFPCDPRSILPRFGDPLLSSEPPLKFFSGSFVHRDVCHPKLWPDFTKKNLFDAVKTSAARTGDRRGVNGTIALCST